MKDDIISRAIRELEDKITKEIKEGKEDKQSFLLYESGFKKINPGMIVEGVVVDCSREGILISTGTKQEGIIPLDELSLKDFKDPSEVVKIGDKINVIVLSLDNWEGNPVFSKKRADLIKILGKLQNAFDNDSSVEGKVISQVKGGLVVDFDGVFGFIPQSQIRRTYVRNLEKYVGKTYELKIIEFNRKKRDIVLSIKKAEDERKKEKIKKVIGELNEGERVLGKIVKLTNFGAFVDLGGIDGLIPISELSHRRINHPKEIVKKGQKISVIVLNVDRENNKVSLSLKEIQPSPWESIKDKISVGSVISGKVTKVSSSYSFVKVDEEIEGFLPHRELGKGRTLEEGQEIKVKVIELDPKHKRLTLSLKNIKEESDEINAFLAKQEKWKGMKLGDVLSQKLIYDKCTG
ncbi:TPA: 30S ribosomal protein S1 [bacterium]|nr:30S ribosomal protein S1 [bacterium]